MKIIVGVLCTILRTCDLCLVVAYLCKCLSFHTYVGDQLLLRSAKHKQSCFHHKCWNDILVIYFKVIDSFFFLGIYVEHESRIS